MKQMGESPVAGIWRLVGGSYIEGDTVISG